MIYLEYNENGDVTYRNGMPFDEIHGLGKTKGELEQTGILVDVIPDPDTSLTTKNAILKINLLDKTLFYEYIDRPLTQEEELDVLKEQQKSANEKYAELDKVNTPLADLKAAKLAALDEMCGYTIVSGFDHDINGESYHFSCSLAAQANFTGAKVRFMAGETTAEEWTAVDNTTGEEVRLMLDELTFKPIADKVYQLIDTSVKKLRNTLQPQVKAATTNAEVDAIVW
jgi:hypothetical protein